MVEKLKHLLDSIGLTQFSDALLKLSLPAVRLTHLCSEPQQIPVGASKVGGRPDVPAGFEWPCWRGSPLSFLCQVNLSDIGDLPAAADLPKDGLLSFFYDAQQRAWGLEPADAGAWLVEWFPDDPASLRPCALPSSCRELGLFEPCLLRFEEVLTLPPWECEAVEQLGMSWDQSDAYVDLLEGLYEQGCHQLFGHPAQIQGPMEEICQLGSNGVNVGDFSYHTDTRTESLLLGSSEWRLLLQLGSDERLGMMWGDCGRLFFWIRREDLAARRFDKIWMVLQCG